MPVAKVYTKSQWEAFARALDALPEKPDTERGVTVRDAMKDMCVRVRTAQAKGYTLEQIAEQAQQQGLDITAGTIRYAMRSTGKGRGAGSVARSAPGARATGAVKASTVQLRAQDVASQTTHVRKDGGKTEARPQSGPVQGALGFAIRPDTDDL
ncbi:hypothetical protein [Burkholderia cepacia]|uniref:hypothetical protein n=1 Tax=Burkholderia cepacia TaxID=292 RepID=UPI00075C7802|nr:hypothetical protein [Burkholderia cepacia]KVA46630.1 hypothetical protein WI47_22380 [Burkholderia cepacia]KVC24343.1 hypothetical protein WI70_00660 [Burkholderia cepacia]